MTILWLLAALVLACSPVQAADRTIYLTFDDGPLDGTGNILDVLQAENVPATMFMVGLHAKSSPESKALVARAKSMPLVTLGNHSYSHAFNRYRKFYADTEGVVADMVRANAALGLDVPTHARLPGRNVFRLPNISTNDLSIDRIEIGIEEPDYEFVAATGFWLYGWDHEWVHDGTGKPVQSVTRLVSEIDHMFTGKVRFVRPNRLILLMHDEIQDTFNGTANLTALIQGLRQRGYSFGHIPDYDPLN
ncbi:MULTISPECIES: polysaccharide deacetylase family protein [Aminobacter]|uniref:Chitooligosaccharide deacetylase n=1 Tax=Aminobacter ciceronei TaxID=150723 RepID=A0ABR6C0T9_9HYPH|nr:MULTISPECIES: polysaccharide deacetylase family protein [Aminobacter]MBA8904549.1 peptidoglycan/xylan/chitin deacetylase (PgdA/CDA1 family) [Aminobacter ciceronei]MBA9018327.1 peptidoglycan/xylan/chitin deacetylase (PgdA/CDA1 family) [Aminobacter ciceronei]MRX33021.1 polysaccharide deacetylase family protein [Aminobacter sp. MDW-2]QNH36656.1 polysaccharide deacetylase family protein [Aminobacter sp. MDW-2]